MGRSWILVTGAGHGGTRLLTRALAGHPDVAIPEDELTVAWELETLHEFFIDTMDRTRLHQPGLNVDGDELAFILDAYEQACEDDPEFVVLKMPHYPLLSLDTVADQLDLAAILYTHRPVDKIYQSNLKRGKDIQYMEREVYLRQVKKCGLDDRRKLIADRDFEDLIRAQVDELETRVKAWNDGDREPPIQEIDLEELTSDPAALREVLSDIGLAAGPADDMLDVVDADRLEQRGLWYKFKQRQLEAKNRLKALLQTWK